MLPHLAGRALTFNRFPNGVEQKGFFEKRCAKHRPPWVPTALGPGDHNGAIQYCVIDEPAALVWAANMAALELHAPMALADDLETPRMVVFDLDPGPPAAIRECAADGPRHPRRARRRRARGAGRRPAGSKGLQLYVPVNTPLHPRATPAAFALAVGQLLERQHPSEVLTSMTKADRKGKVFVDWSQNARHKTTIAVVLDAGPAPTRRCRRPSRGTRWRRRADGRHRPALPVAATCSTGSRRSGDLFAPVLDGAAAARPAVSEPG